MQEGKLAVVIAWFAFVSVVAMVLAILTYLPVTTFVGSSGSVMTSSAPVAAPAPFSEPATYDREPLQIASADVDSGSVSVSEHVRWEPLRFDTVVGDVSSVPEGVGFLSSEVSGLLEHPSCESLREIANRDQEENPDGYSVQLPRPLSGPAGSLCGYAYRGDSVLFYAIGNALVYEELPHIGSAFLLLEPDHRGWVSYEPVSSEGFNVRYEAMYDENLRDHPTAEFPNAEHSKVISPVYDAYERDLEHPTPMMQDLFETLKYEAERVALPE